MWATYPSFVLLVKKKKKKPPGSLTVFLWCEVPYKISKQIFF